MEKQTFLRNKWREKTTRNKWREIKYPDILFSRHFFLVDRVNYWHEINDSDSVKA